MNRFEGPGSREAKIRYLDGDFQVLSPGSYVLCSVTSEKIPLDELKYWSVELQEAYAAPEAAGSLRRRTDFIGARDRDEPRSASTQQGLRCARGARY